MFSEINDYNLIVLILSKLTSVFVGVFSTFDSIPNLSVQLFDGGVSHIVAAALETKGLIDQGVILKNLTVLNEIASLFYLFAIAMAIGAVAVFGSYKQGLYLLIGPALYSFMVTTTVETNGVRAIVGNYEIPNSISRQSRFLNKIRAIEKRNTNVPQNVAILDDSYYEPSKADISLFFAVFDGITTQVMQQINAVLLNTENREHLKIEGRERVLNYLMMTFPVGGVIPQMISRHHGECSHVMNEYYAAGKDQKKNVMVTKRAQSDVEKLRTEANQKWGEAKIALGSSDVEMKSFLIAMAGSPDFPIDIGIKDEKEEVILTCNQLWVMIAATLKQVANKSMDPTYYKGSLEKEDYHPERLEMEDVKEFLKTPFKNNTAEEVLTTQIYKNVLNQTTHSALNSQLFSNSPFNATDYHVAYQELPGAEARGAFHGLRYFATTIPYIQGLLLYLLTVGFPFFAVLLVIPGKAQSFLVWCSLWVWVKSWDVGFALILVFRDILWHMLKYRQNTFDNTIDLKDPFSVYGVILNNDPLATMNTYWEVSFALTLMVPFLTAHFCLGATNFFEMFRNGIDQTAGRFRQFETLSAKRDIGSSVEASIADDKYRFQSAMMQEMLESETQDTERRIDKNGKIGGRTNARGMQTMYGQAISLDREELGTSIKNATTGLANASGSQAKVTYDIAGALAQIGTKPFTDTIGSQVGQIDRLEGMVKDRLQGKTVKDVYLPPKEFTNITELNSAVPKAVIERESKAYQEKIDSSPSGQRAEMQKAQFDPNKTYAWKEFLVERAVQNEQQLRIPNIMRGIPDMNKVISKEKLAYIFMDQNHPLRIKAESGKPVTWGEATNHFQEHQRNQFNYLAATTGRKHMPPVQSASDGFASAVVSAESIAIKAKTAVSGTEPGKYEGAMTTPGMEYLFNKANETIGTTTPGLKVFDYERPGISSADAVKGRAGVSPAVDVISK